MKQGICSILGVISGAIASAFGGWDSALMTLAIFMLIDYFSGVICAGVFHKSQKSESGALESKAGFKGLAKKGMQLLIVLVACRLDLLIGTHTFIRDAVVIAFVTNETISILENAGLMGIPLPKALTKAIEVLKEKEKESEESI